MYTVLSLKSLYLKNAISVRASVRHAKKLSP
jgi:hypothetical protein